MKNPARPLGFAFAITVLGGAVSGAQQHLDWENYCTVGSHPLCSSIMLTLTPNGGSTDVSIQLRNLEGTLGTTPWALYNVTFDHMNVNIPINGFVTPTVHATLSGSADYLVTADPVTCATNPRLGGCPGPGWGDVEWDWGGSAADVQIGSHNDDLPKPFGVVGCDAPPQPSTSSNYWGGGYFQTCGDGWVNFNFAVRGAWMFDELSQLSIVTYDGSVMSSCVFGQTCLQQQLTATPEPATLWLMATGLVGLAGAVRRRRSQRLVSVA